MPNFGSKTNALAKEIGGQNDTFPSSQKAFLTLDFPCTLRENKYNDNWTEGKIGHDKKKERERERDRFVAIEAESHHEGTRQDSTK